MEEGGMSEKSENLFSVLMPKPQSQLKTDIIRTAYGPIPILVNDSLLDNVAEVCDPLIGRIIGRITILASPSLLWGDAVT
jgi:hypothetical protein